MLKKILCIFLTKISAYRRDFDKAKSMFFVAFFNNRCINRLRNNKECFKKSPTLSRTNLAVNLYTMKNVYKLK